MSTGERVPDAVVDDLLCEKMVSIVEKSKVLFYNENLRFIYSMGEVPFHQRIKENIFIRKYTAKERKKGKYLFRI